MKGVSEILQLSLFECIQYLFMSLLATESSLISLISLLQLFLHHMRAFFKWV